jgi:hypothetical protein
MDFVPVIYWFMVDGSCIHCTQSPAMTKTPAEISDPERVSRPENCIDSGGFYLRCMRPNVAKRIDQDAPEMAISNVDIQKEKQVSRDVTYAINGGYIDEDRRLEYTRLAKNILS